MGLRVAVPIAAVFVVAACSSGTSLPTAKPAPTTPTAQTTQTAHGVSVARGTLTKATLDVTSGATTVNVTTADLHGRLVSATTPAGSSQRPTVGLTTNGTATVRLASIGPGGGTADLTIELDRSVRWTVQLDGGATTETLDLRSGDVRDISLGAGASRATVRLPALAGQTLLQESGGLADLDVTVPHPVATSVSVAGGAGSVQIGSVTHAGVAGGSTFHVPGYATAKDRLRIDLTAGVSRLTVRRQ